MLECRLRFQGAAQWTVIRMASADNADLAMFITGLSGKVAVDAAERLRLEQLLREHIWAGFHIWDRMERGIFPKGTFEGTGGGAFGSFARDEIR